MNSTNSIQPQDLPTFSSIDSEEYISYVESIQTTYHEHFKSGKLRDLEQILLKDIQIAKTMNDTTRELEQLLRLGIVYIRLEDWDAAELILSVLLNRVETMNQPLLYGRVVGTLGDLYRLQNKVFEAFELIQTSLEIFRELGNQQLEAVALGNIACLLIETNRSNDAEPFLKQAIELSNRMGDQVNEVNHSINYSKVLLRQGKLYDAKNLLTSCILQMQEANILHMEAIATSSLAMVLGLSDQWIKAKPLYLKALELFRMTENVRLEGITLNNLADFEWKHGDVQEAKSCVRQVIELMEPLKDWRTLVISFLLRGAIEEWEGNLSHSLASLTKGIDYAQRAQNQHLLALAYVSRGWLYDELSWFKEAEHEMEWALQYVTEIVSDDRYELECKLLPYLVQNHKWDDAEVVYHSICATRQSKALYSNEISAVVAEFIYVALQMLHMKGADTLIHSLTTPTTGERMDWYNWFSDTHTPPLYVYWNHVLLLAKTYGLQPRISVLRQFLKTRRQLIRLDIPAELLPIPKEWESESLPPLL